MSLDPLEDGKSSVEIIAHMGDDLMVVNTARVSYNKESKWAFDYIDNGKTKDFPTNPHLSEADQKLIHYLATHNHISPFFHPQIQFRYKMPIFVAREWFRHNIGISRNEVSRRYVDSEPEVFIPNSIRGRALPGQSKQGSNPNRFKDSDQEILSGTFSSTIKTSVDIYNGLIATGVAPEQARLVLPMALYTEFIETASLHACARIFSLRSTKDVQEETRKYALAMGELVGELFPVSWSELTERGDA